MNSIHNIGKPQSKTRIVKRILRFLPEKLIPKIIIIEESKDLNTLTENKLVVLLCTFEFNILNHYSSQKKNKTTAFYAHNSQLRDVDEEFDLMRKNWPPFLSKAWKNSLGWPKITKIAYMSAINAMRKVTSLMSMPWNSISLERQNTIIVPWMPLIMGFFEWWWRIFMIS